MDALSELLRAVKLTGAVFINAEGRAPWCWRSPPSRVIGPLVGYPSSHIIVFHLIMGGRAFVRLGSETTALVAGDIVMCPHGEGHDTGNGFADVPIDGEKALPGLLTSPLKLAHLGRDGEATQLICGYLACEARLIQPVLAGLPHVVRVPIRGDAAGEWLENSIRHAVNQASDGAPGGEVVLARLAEVLFAEALRRYLLQLPPGRTGWLAGAGDPSVGRCLGAMHRRPGHAWTIDELTREAGLSRTALTERFTRYLGQPPMGYLKDWRLELAAESLRSTSRSVVQVAAEVGYESESAFNRAFKQRFGSPPAAYRRQQRDPPRSSTN